jgi:thymidylate synthase (FAD)
LKISDIEVSYVDHMGTDLSVVNAARVSFAKGSTWESEAPFPVITGWEPEVKVLREQDRKLINYLAKHKHYSPFNHTFLSFRIKAPIFVARQLVKHEYMPWNEVSRRYVDSEPEFYFPELRAKAGNVKQGSANHGLGDQSENGKMILFMATEAALNMYNDLKQLGVCPEQARMVLPHNLMTEWVWSGTLKAFHKMLTLRLDPHTQVETRIVAEKIAPVIETLFPVSFPALMENN